MSRLLRPAPQGQALLRAVALSVAHSAGGSLATVLGKQNLRSGFRALTSGREVLVSSRYRGERFAWVMLHVTGRQDAALAMYPRLGYQPTHDGPGDQGHNYYFRKTLC